MEANWPVEEMVAHWRPKLLQFDELAQAYFLYG